MADKLASMALVDLKLKVAEHIWMQNNQRKTQARRKYWQTIKSAFSNGQTWSKCSRVSLP